MKCGWNSLLCLLPGWMRSQVDKEGKDNLQELRLRLGEPPELVLGENSLWLERSVTAEDISFCINLASRYSPWAVETMTQGYLTALGGHRIGICGCAVYKNGSIGVTRDITSLCIRVARDYPGIGENINATGSVLILGAPGWGKTTLLRDLARVRARKKPVAVVDERGELFPEGFLRGKRMDVLVGARKPDGIDRVLRTMGPDTIAVDEITAGEDCNALYHAAGCGVKLLATAHAGSLEEFYERPLYKPLADSKLFDYFLILQRDKSFKVERRRL